MCYQPHGRATEDAKPPPLIEEEILRSHESELAAIHTRAAPGQVKVSLVM
jgi:hypothetical protein